MSVWRLVLVGFGTVGQGFARLLHDKAAYLAAEYGFRAAIVGVYTRRVSLFRPEGLDVPALLEAMGGGEAYPDQPGLRRGLFALDMLSQPHYDVAIEATPTDFKTGEPALSHIRAALEANKHAVTVNKGPIALAFRDLRAMAGARGLFLGYEGVVMGGTPSIRLAQTALAGCTISEIRGILNSTTNFMLTCMETGLTYAEALAEAQALGYAETDPSGDVEGHDAAGKILIMANLLFGGALRVGDVAREGITGITPEAIAEAKAAGERWKLIASARWTPSGAVASVAPIRLRLSDPLAGVMGPTSAVTYQTDVLGPVTLIGTGAGGTGTGFAILSDLLAIHREHHRA